MSDRFDVKRQSGFTAIALVCFFTLYVPMIALVVGAFNSSESMSSWGGISLVWFRQALNNEQVIEASVRSVKIACVAAVIATVVATMAALATTRSLPYRGRTLTYMLINQPLVVPEIVTAVALLIVFSAIKTWTGYTGIGYLISAHTTFCVPFAYLPIRARLESMDLSLEAAGADLYATPWNIFKEITLPLLWPGVVSGLSLAFVASLDNVVITEFVKNVGEDTLPTYMLGQLRRGTTPEINAIAVAFLLLSIIVVALIAVLSKSEANTGE